MDPQVKKKPKNKLYCQGYFIARLVDSGFDVLRLNIPYEQDDMRKWTIVVNAKNGRRRNTMITCFKDNETKDFFFKFQGQKKKEFALKTLSMGIIVKILKKVSEDIDARAMDGEARA